MFSNHGMITLMWVHQKQYRRLLVQVKYSAFSFVHPVFVRRLAMFLFHETEILGTLSTFLLFLHLSDPET